MITVYMHANSADELRLDCRPCEKPPGGARAPADLVLGIETRRDGIADSLSLFLTLGQAERARDEISRGLEERAARAEIANGRGRNG